MVLMGAAPWALTQLHWEIQTLVRLPHPELEVSNLNKQLNDTAQGRRTLGSGNFVLRGNDVILACSEQGA